MPASASSTVPNAEERVEKLGISQMAQRILADFHDKRVTILSPLVRGRKGEYRGIVPEAYFPGVCTPRINGTIYRIEDAPGLQKYKTILSKRS